MLNELSSLKGFGLQGNDGTLGTVADFLFDDSTWKVRWLVADDGGWLTGRKFLIHPSAVVSVEPAIKGFTVALTKEQVKSSPEILEDRPVSQQMQNDLYDYYGWSPLWSGGMFGGGVYGGMSGIAMPVAAPGLFGNGNAREAVHRDRRDGATCKRPTAISATCRTSSSTKQVGRSAISLSTPRTGGSGSMCWSHHPR
jgi:hypothetical protein